jgi:hypothetical protein
MPGHIRADLDAIARVSGALRVLADEFAALTSVADEAGAAGNAALASALSDFATGWSDKRNQLIGQLRELSQGATGAVREYTAADTALAPDVTGSGTGSAAGLPAGRG